MDEDEEERELERLKWTGVAACLFLISAYFSISELRYGIWGRTIQGNIVRTSKDVDHERMTVRYTFSEPGGKERNETDDVSVDWELPSTGPVDVQYIPGTTTSRIHGNSHTWWVYVFLGSLLILGICLRWLIKFANEPFARSKSRKKRRRRS